MHIFIFGNSFLTVHDLGVVNETKVHQEGPMYALTSIHTFATAHVCTAVKNVKRATVLDLITPAIDI